MFLYINYKIEEEKNNFDISYKKITYSFFPKIRSSSSPDSAETTSCSTDPYGIWSMFTCWYIG
jgi:hypothetical protein